MREEKNDNVKIIELNYGDCNHISIWEKNEDGEYENVLEKIAKDINKTIKLSWFERIFLNSKQKFKRRLEKIKKMNKKKE